MNKLVSIVSPCYNGERYIKRYLEMILNQTYRPLELILVNDGSKDQTDNIIKEFSHRINEDGEITFKYITKENGGVGSAVNTGLKQITGDYLIWPDSDDILMPESIEKRVAFLEAHPEFGFVYSDGLVFDENNLTEPKKDVKASIPADGNLFVNVVSGNVVYNPCGYMLRMEAFLDVNPEKEIIPSRYGQNIQMLMPISYKYKCGYIKEYLYGRVDTENSLSKRVWTETDTAWRDRVHGLEEIYVGTLKSIGGDALAYIPYIYYRNLRILSAISKNIGGNTEKLQDRTLKTATSLLLKELIKFIFRKG